MSRSQKKRPRIRSPQGHPERGGEGGQETIQNPNRLNKAPKDLQKPDRPYKAPKRVYKASNILDKYSKY